MDYKTKAYYRDKIKEIAKRTKISELYITRKALELARINKKGDNEHVGDNKTAHIGYYLISDGINDLYKALQTNKKPKSMTKSVTCYIISIIILSILISGALSLYIYKQTNIILSLIIFILTFIPATQIATEIIQYILNKISKPKLIPKMDYITGVPKEASTMIIIPTIVKSKEKVKELISKLEVFYLANKSENIYFTLLGDTSSSKKENEDFDQEIIEQGKKEIERLNKKYPNERNGKIPIYI